MNTINRDRFPEIEESFINKLTNQIILFNQELHGSGWGRAGWNPNVLSKFVRWFLKKNKDFDFFSLRKTIL